MTIGSRIGVVIIRGYQLLVSPFTGGACRFEPSCSAYAVEALEQHGFWRGMWLAKGISLSSQDTPNPAKPSAATTQ